MILKNFKELIISSKSILETKNKKNVIFLRSCENVGSLSGSLNGWLDVKLSDYGILNLIIGRKQAKNISLEYFHTFHSNTFNKIFCSDLKRAKETADLCFAFENVKIEENQLLREIFFGKNEGLYFDGNTNN